MRNQTIKNPAPTLEPCDLELGPPLDAGGNPLSPDEIAKTSDLLRHSTKEEMAKSAERLSQPGIVSAYKRVDCETGEVFEAKNFAELETQRTKMLEMTRAALDQMTRQGQMTRDEWEEPFSCFVGCEALLCELAPDFDFENSQEANLGDYQRAAEAAIWHEAKAVTHKDAHALRKAIEEEQGRELWRLLARCDEILGATGKWRLSRLERIEFDEAHPKQYSLREYMAFAQKKRWLIEELRQLSKSECDPTAKSRAPSTLKSDKSNFQTGLESDCLLQGASDGERLTGYRQDRQRGVWIYEQSGASHRIELRQEPLTDDDEPLEINVLEGLIKNQSADFAFAFFYICRLLAPPAPLPPHLFSGGWIDLDDVATQVGYDIDGCTALEREELRAKIWQFVLFGARALVIGQRKTYRDRATGESIETQVESPAWRILDKERPVQGALFGEIPRRVQLLISKEWEPLLTAPALAQYLPGAEIVAAIPPNQAAGAWARVIGMALANFWRRLPQEATGAAPAIQPTRRELLTRYTPKTHNKHSNAPLEILASKDPKRAVKYWRDALAMLRERGFIARDGEAARTVEQMLEPLPKYKWQEAWLDERVDLRPGAAVIESVRERAAAKPTPKPRALNAPKRKTQRAKPQAE